MIRDLLARLFGRTLTSSAPALKPVPPPVVETSWQVGYDGLTYPQSTWTPHDTATVTWRGHSRPVIAGELGNPNHVEAARTIAVPAGATLLTFTGLLTVKSDDVNAGREPVTGGIRIWVDGVSSPIDQASCYRAPVEDDNAITREVSVSMPVQAGSRVSLYLTAYSAAGGAIAFERLQHVFTR